MTKRRDKRTDNGQPSKVWFWALACLIIFCVFSYGFLFREIMVDIVARQNMDKNLSVLSSRVVSLESDYYKAKNAITPEMAASLGFIAVSGQKFVTRDANNPGLSLVGSGN